MELAARAAACARAADVDGLRACFSAAGGPDERDAASVACLVCAEVGFLAGLDFLTHLGAAVVATQAGNSPAHLAAKNGHDHVLAWLAKRPARDAVDGVASQNGVGQTPLMFAASAGQAACVAALIAHADARAALDAQSGQGETALVYACLVAYGEVTCMSLGVAHASGAAAVGFDECVRLLVAAGADVQLADSRGRCARTACPKHASIVERMAELERDAVASALRLVAEDAPATAKMKKTKAKRNRRPHRRDEPPRGAHASLQPSPSSSEDEAAADEAVAEAVADEAADDDARSIEERRIDEERRIEESRRLKEFLEGRLEAQRLDEERRLDERRLDEERRLEELRLVDEAKRRDEGRSAAVQRPSQKDVDGDSPARQQHVPASPAPASLEVRAASPEAASPEASDEVEASEAQRLLELLHPAASALALKVEHLLCATPLQSSSQLEALHSILDVCLRRVIEARIVNAVDHEREMLRSLARGPPTAKDPVDP